MGNSRQCDFFRREENRVGREQKAMRDQKTGDKAQHVDFVWILIFKNCIDIYETIGSLKTDQVFLDIEEL